MSGIRDWIYSYEPIAGTEDFELVIDVELGQSYEWDTLLAFYSPSKRRFFWVSGSGCSCNSISEEVNSVSDFSDGNRESLIAAIRAHYDSSYSAKVSDALDDIARVKNYWASNGVTS